MLYQMQKTRGLYFHTCSRVFKNREGTITLFNLSTHKLKVPSISNVHCFPKKKPEIFTMTFCSICTIIRLLILKSTHNKVMKPVVAKRTQTFKYWRAKSPIGVKSTKMFWLLVKTNSSTAFSRIWLNTKKNFVWQHYVNSKKLKAINGQLSRHNNKSVTFPSWSYFRLNRLFL